MNINMKNIKTEWRLRKSAEGYIRKEFLLKPWMVPFVTRIVNILQGSDIEKERKSYRQPSGRPVGRPKKSS